MSVQRQNRPHDVWGAVVALQGEQKTQARILSEISAGMTEMRGVVTEMSRAMAARPPFSMKESLGLVRDCAVLLGMAVGAIVYVAGGRYAPVIRR